MAEDDHPRPGSNDLQTPFLFVPYGDPLPLEWMARHPGWVKFPATFVPHRQAGRAAGGTQARARTPPPPLALATPNTDAAILAMTASQAAAIPGVLDTFGAAATAGAIAVPLAPVEAVLVLVAVVVAGVLVYQYMTREQARSLGVHPAPPPATPMPPTLPANPGLVPPPAVPDRPADPGPLPVSSVPDLPALPQVDPIPHVLSTPASDQGGANVFHHDRNEGVPPGGARTYSSRARKNARIADPDVTRALENSEWEAHHLVTVAAAQEDPELLEAAVRGGWRMDGPSNVIALPASPDAQTKLNTAGIRRPLHNSGHPVSVDEAKTALRAVPQRLKNSSLTRGTPEYDKAARKAFEDLSDRLRREMNRLGRVSENEQASPEQDA